MCVFVRVFVCVYVGHLCVLCVCLCACVLACLRKDSYIGGGWMRSDASKPFPQHDPGPLFRPAFCVCTCTRL